MLNDIVQTLRKLRLLTSLDYNSGDIEMYPHELYLRDIKDDLYTLNKQLYIAEISIGENSSDDSSDIDLLLSSQSSSDKINYIKINTRASKASPVFKNFDMLVSYYNNKFELPEDFYLVEEDYWHSDQKDSSFLTKNIVSHDVARKFLANLSPYHDSKEKSLIFTVDSHKKPLIINMEYKRGVYDLNEEQKKFSLLVELSQTNNNNPVNHEEKKILFYCALSEFLESKNKNDALTFLLSNWSDFERLYKNNLSIYLNGFSFHKIEKEILDEKLKVINSLSSCITDIANKLFSLPVSFAAVLGLKVTNDVIINVSILAGIILTTVIMACIISAQYDKFFILKDDIKVSMEDLERQFHIKIKSSEELKKMIKKSHDDIKKTICYTEIKLCGFSFVTFLPLASAVIVMLGLYL